MVGSFENNTHIVTGGKSAAFFLILYLLASMIFLLDIFITLLNEFLGVIRRAPPTTQDAEVIDHLLQNLRSFFTNSEVKVKSASKSLPPVTDMCMSPAQPTEREMNTRRRSLIKISD